MAETNNSTRWEKYVTIFLTAILSGIVSVSAALLIQRLSKENNEISYTISDPIVYLDENTIRELDVQINDVPITNLVAYNIRVWNSGDFDYDNLQIQIEFDDVNEFEVFRATHSMSPKPVAAYNVIPDFEIYSDNTMDFTIPLFNKDSEINFSLLTNKKADVSVRSTAKGMKLLEVSHGDDDNNNWNIILAVFVGFFMFVMVGVVQFLLEAISPEKKNLESRQALVEFLEEARHEISEAQKSDK